jgi:hypothetical protein
VTDYDDQIRRLEDLTGGPLPDYVRKGLPKPKAPRAARPQNAEKSAAAHAAGHVIAAVLLGIDLTHASRLSSPTQWELVELNTHPIDLAVMLVAGPISQTAVMYHPNRNHYCPADLAHAADLAARATGATDNPADTLALAITRACAIVEQHRRAIWKTTELLEKQDLDYIDIIGVGASLR